MCLIHVVKGRLLFKKICAKFTLKFNLIKFSHPPFLRHVVFC